MSTDPTSTADAAGRLMTALRDIPFWLFLALALACNILLFIPQIKNELPPEWHPWLVTTTVLFTCLALVRGLANLAEYKRVTAKSKAERQIFFCQNGRAHWSTTRQPDNSDVTFIHANISARTNVSYEVGLVSVCLVRPKIRGKILDQIILIRHPQSDIYGSTAQSGHFLPPDQSWPVSISLSFRGRTKFKSEDDINAVIQIGDDKGGLHKVCLKLSGQPSPTPSKKPVLEAVYKLTDPVEKEIVAILQSELSRYEKHNRSSGGLGSLHITIDGREIRSIGQDSWSSNSPKNQSIHERPEGGEIISDNLLAMFANYEKQKNDTERQHFVTILLNRLGGPYLSISYFIVCVLWRTGHLPTALNNAKQLPQEDRISFGISNILLMLNGLLRYQYHLFSDNDLDVIENFLDSVNEHPFLIKEKISAIRTARIAKA